MTANINELVKLTNTSGTAAGLFKHLSHEKRRARGEKTNIKRLAERLQEEGIKAPVDELSGVFRVLESQDVGKFIDTKTFRWNTNRVKLARQVLFNSNNQGFQYQTSSGPKTVLVRKGAIEIEVGLDVLPDLIKRIG